jgi:Ca-activated chloride channel family protein
VSFGSPYLLLFLLAIPAAIGGLLLLERRRRRRGAAFASPSLLPNLVTSPPPWRRWLPTGLLLVGAALLLVGFARPRTDTTVGRNEATLVVVVDISGSMAAKDAPPTRLRAARRTVRNVLAKLPESFRVAAVAFSDHSAVVAPPTRDRQVVLGALNRLHTGPQGTALLEAALRAVRLGHALPPVDGKRPPATVLVLSDGGANAGRTTQQQVVAAAHKDGIPISAVVIGTPSGIVTQKLQGGYTERIAVPVQPQTLTALARGTGGRVYRTGADLTRVVGGLRERTGREHKTVEVTAATAGGGLALMLAGGLLSGVWFRRIP